MIKEITVKSILNKHKKRDEWFLDDYSLNPYKNCQFNCIYCYIHGSKYGEHIGNELAVKINAPNLLERELYRRAKRKEFGFIALSSSTEPWMPIEEKYRLTRKCLEVIVNYKFPVHCLTKSKLILRDLDLLSKINENAILPVDLRNKLNCGVLITISISTLNDSIASIFEPNAPKPKERLEVLYRLRNEGFNAGIAYIPVLPFISDSNEQLELMIKTAKEYNTNYIFIGALTLFGFGKKSYYNVIQKYFPELLVKYKRLYGKFSYPIGNYSKRLEINARRLCEKYGVKYMILQL